MYNFKDPKRPEEAKRKIPKFKKCPWYHPKTPKFVTSLLKKS